MTVLSGVPGDATTRRARMRCSFVTEPWEGPIRGTNTKITINPGFRNSDRTQTKPMPPARKNVPRLLSSTARSTDDENTAIYPVGIGLGTDYNFMDRMARVSGTDKAGLSPRGSGNPADYEQLCQCRKRGPSGP